MKIALVGYGKMGRMIETTAKARGYSVVATIDNYAPDASFKISSDQELVSAVKNSGADVVIEFTHPEAVLNNIRALVPVGIPLVVGTTGWLAKLDEVADLVKTHKSSLFYSANYSIGVNMFYKIVEHASHLMAQFDEYDTALWDIHHNQKADSPSGTALDLAKKILANEGIKTELVVDAFHTRPQKQQLHVSSTRVGATPGTHTVFFDSPADTIELTHRARSRDGFAMGAVRAAAWLHEGLVNKSLKKGQLYTMENML